jgi:hypothetical protein
MPVRPGAAAGQYLRDEAAALGPAEQDPAVAERDHVPDPPRLLQPDDSITSEAPVSSSREGESRREEPVAGVRVLIAAVLGAALVARACNRDLPPADDDSDAVTAPHPC